MRLNINLASQKYEEQRQFLVRAWATVIITAVITAMLLALAWFNYAGSTKSRARINELKQKISALQKERASAEAFENRPENRDVTEQKNFWNGQFNRRRFSWTQLFNDLQKIMPGRAYVTSVSPELTPDNRLKLKLAIAGEKHENALQLVQKMEGSERFRQPQITVETVQRELRPGAPPLYKFEIETFYTPAGMPSAHGTREGM